MIELFSILAIWRITSFLVKEQGPFNMFVFVREHVKLPMLFNFDCFWCLNVWIALPFAIYRSPNIELPIYWFGYSALVIAFEEILCLVQDAQAGKTHK